MDSGINLQARIAEFEKERKQSEARRGKKT